MQDYTILYLAREVYPFIVLPVLFVVINLFYLFPGRIVATRRQKKVYPLGVLPFSNNGYYLGIFLFLTFWSILSFAINLY